MTVAIRQQIEREIVTAVVEAALTAGYTLAVDNGGDEDEYKGTDKEAILAAMFATDEEYLHFYHTNDNRSCGSVFFVYGNDGYDVICDYNTSLEAVLAEALAIGIKYGG